MKSNLVILCFLFIGFTYSIPRFLLFMATEDIMAGTLIQSSVVLILLGCTDSISTACFPFLIRKISFLWAFFLFSLLWLMSYLLVVLADDAKVRFIGVGIYGVANSLGNVSVILLIACFDEIEKCASAYSTGAMSSAILTGFLYTGTTVWLCFPPKLTITICFPLGLLTILFYVILNHGHFKKCQKTEHEEYTALSTGNRNGSTIVPQLTSVFAVTCLYLISEFAYFLAANSVLTTLAFPSAPFRARDHYQYYRFVADIGTFFGGMEMMMMSNFCPSWKNNISPRYRTTLILLLASIAHLLFFAFASWYRFVPSVYIILVLSFCHGVLYGSIAVRGLVHVGENFESSKLKGTAMSICSIGHGLGRAVSGFLGIFIEERMREHCTNELFLESFCLARFPSSVGWDENMQCS